VDSGSMENLCTPAFEPFCMKFSTKIMQW
jgi:hypothetical protein